MSANVITGVILAGGQGKRMRSTDRHKVCFPIAGVPAIVRTVGMLKSVGVGRVLVVVGQMAEQVITTVAAAHPDVAFVFQAAPRGTGHAAACAAAHLAACGCEGQVIVTMGDKIIQPHVVARLIERHGASGADMTLTALPKSDGSTAGRIVTDAKGNVLGIVELPDIRRAVQKRRKIPLAGKRLTGRQIERASRRVNASLYMFRAPAFCEAVAALSDENAQGELYLTDAPEILTFRGRSVEVLDSVEPEDLMAYNTPEELLAIEEVFRKRQAGRRTIVARPAKLPGRTYRKASEWLKIVQSNRPGLRRTLRGIYGPDEELLAERRKALGAVLREFIRIHGGDRKAVLVRAPGRINLMGRHVDHRGGYVNVMAISREVVLAAGPRDDDAVTLANVDRRRFPDRDFRIGELLRSADWMGWMDYINSNTVRQVLEAHRGDWSNYAKAAVLRLQHACPDHRLGGMDCVVAGNIPMGAGLSSSSAVVVAMAETATLLNGLDLTTRQFVDLCGEGEWFVGSRGGSADHAAIRSGERGRVARVGFFPFRIERTFPFPPELSLVIANSHIRAAKSEGARDTFNHRVATYNLAEMLMRKRSRLLASMEHLRDVDPEALDVSPAEVYRAIKRLPRQISRRKAFQLLGEHRDRLEVLFDTHRTIGAYRLRDVATYGIAECRRSDLFADLLAGGRVDEVGRMMRVSHDGDRVVEHRDGQAVPFAPSYADGKLDRLILDAASEDPVRQARAALPAQPGRYACSTPRIDYMVDLAGAQEGVIGAQLAGAGLGGCCMILVRTDFLAKVLSALRRGYYRVHRLPFDVHVCQPVAGSGPVSV